MSKYIYRKEIASIFEVSVFQVMSNEARWGIKPFRRDGNRRVVRYLRKPAIQALESFFSDRGTGGSRFLSQSWEPPVPS